MTVDSMESLRVLTLNTIRFIAQAGPIIKPKKDQGNDILEKQIAYMNRALLEGRMSFENYRDLIEVFAEYWVQRCDVTDGGVVKRPEQCIEQNENELKSQLLQCMASALDKNVQVVDLIKFCRVYDELLVDLRNLPLEWFVRLPTEDYNDIFIKKNDLSIVQNKWMGSERQCYSVENVGRFKTLYLALFDEPKIPRHFLFETIKSLLACIIDLETKEQWIDGVELTESDQLNATGLLIASIRSSLLYLKEQPDYINFDGFFEESTRPFIIVTNESISYVDFEKRINIVKESFWYFRKSNEIDIAVALLLYKESSELNYNGERLRYCYRKYNEKFDELMGKHSSTDTVAKIASIVADVTRETDSTNLTAQWDTDFKSNKLPEILAGLSAVWALHVSRDMASTGQYLKPHCIQILCVFRLLSADREDEGVRKHLAQVLTGQGKSLVLALVASVLALCGHSVQIMCYIKYLATRDGKEFEDFYDLFGIHSKISYQTFEEAAKERLNQIAGNATQYVHSCIGLPNVKSYSGVILPNPVLLVDEVDVLFDEKLYGETYNMGTFPRIPGIDKIQLFIWKMVQKNCTSIREKVDIYLKDESDPQIAMFNNLINKSGTFALLIHCGDQSIGKTFTNSSLFSMHIDRMISIAKQVHDMEPNHSVFNEFRLNSTGKIAVRQSFGNYSETTYKNYYNAFIYFRLKGTNFEEGKTNYGYLNVRLGSISYAKIPEDFSLILGVSGTLTSLSSYEKKVVNDHYNITEMTVMPSFFGGSNLKFNETVDFNCFNTATEWTNAIFGRINVTVNAKRSVLVIFNSDVEINGFKQQFAAQLDRLNVLTVNTDPADKERFISDAGVSRTITLATREMGRGVDYKSSVAVESNGGVHVIQTFFSVGVKEETQIKGRTARKDNRGSYELIVCVDDLGKENFVDSQESYLTVTYDQLNNKRNVQMMAWMMVKDESRVEKLKVANKNHQATVDFYKNK
ncbi:protein translocase subunit SecA 2-like [Culex pipiens pallens]|uniref:protein translocase subunit SecA 2-like n=1 Tax=Culex pipiens pallens TaxID=42434 RepID=UPI0019543060|nr:protein translocase subunit SecA 2-like [Culex pipiens pallens]